MANMMVPCRILVAPCAKHRKVWLTPAAGVPCSNAAKIRERKTWTQSEFCTWKNSVTGPELPKMYTSCTSPGEGQTLCKVWLASVERHRCSNAAKTWNPLKFAGVPQTTGSIAAANGPSSPYCGEIWRYCCLTSFFLTVDTCLSCEDIARQKLWLWCPDANFWRFFCVLYLQQTACSTFQTCILNLH